MTVNPKCSFNPCDNPRKSKGFCSTHYAQMSRGAALSQVLPDNPCPSPDCGRMKSHSARRCKRCNQLRWRYSLTDSWLDLNFAPGRYKCSNLGCEKDTLLQVDHDHACCPEGRFGSSHKRSCGRCVRGWLCKGCNVALGLLQENPQKIRGLLEYITDKG